MLNFSKQKADGAKINNLAFLQFNLLKRYFISEINVPAAGMTSARLKHSSGELAGTFSQQIFFMATLGILGSTLSLPVIHITCLKITSNSWSTIFRKS